MSMNCIYIYKGHTFNSETELNDFLLEKDKYLSKYGDIVFSEKTEQIVAVDKLHDASEKAKEIKKQYDLNKIRYTEDGAREEMKLPYMGVNDFLDGMTNSDDKLFYPKFIEFEYWRRRFLDWSEGNYTDDEKEVFGFDDKNAPKLEIHPDLKSFFLDKSLSEEELNKKIKEITTKEQQELRDKMEFKWKNQALFGDVIHFIGQKLFSTVHDGPLAGKMWIDVVDDNEQKFLWQISKDKYDEKLQPIREKFTPGQIKQAIKYFKELKNKIEHELGDENLMFIPEPGAVGTLNQEFKGVDHLLGRIDLVVVDSKGNAHVIDYKTSPKPYTKYNDAKKLGYTYQLATYTRILAQNGLRYNNMRSFVAPIQLNGFKLNESGEYQFKEIKYDLMLDELTKEIKTSEHIINNLNEKISIPENLTATAENLINNVDKQMKIVFPEFGKKKSEEEIRDLIQKADGFKKRTDLEKPYGYFPEGNETNPILANSETDLIQKVSAYYNNFQEQIKGYTTTIKDAIKYGIENNTSDIQLPESKNTKNASWVRNTLSKYLNKNWQILEGEGYNSAEEFGIIFLQNVHTRHVEVITVALNNLDINPSKNNKMKNLTYGLGESDIIENSKSNSKMLEATNGNIRLMETMMVLNNLKFNDDINISQIHVINPRKSKGTWAPNEQLLYSFNKLMDLAKSKGKDIGENNLKDGKHEVKFATKSQLALLTLKNIQNITGNSAEKINGMASTITALDSGIRINNASEILLQLEELKDLFEQDKELSRYIKNPNSIIEQPYYIREAMTAYSQILWAIAEHKGYEYTQQLNDHNFKAGWEGLYLQTLENPGNYASNILNTASRVMQEAYQNVRDVLSKEFRKVAIAVDTLKEKEGFSKLKEYTTGNQSSLYKDIVYRTPDNDLMVKNPWDSSWNLGEAKREFTKMFLMEINKDRYNKSDAELEIMIKEKDYDFFKLPLIKSGNAGKAAQKSLFDRFKTRISRFKDGTYYKDKISNFLSDEAESEYKKDEEVFKMNNMMDLGNGPGRKAFIAKQLAKDSAYFEIDLENILMIHKEAYTIQKEMDQRMPIIKAAAFSLKVMGDYQGEDFNMDYETIEKTVKTKIKNESQIENPKLKVVAGITKDLQQMASFMALAFAPVQASGQTLNGLFTNIKLNWTFDREIFSKENLISSFKEVGKDLVHFGTTPTLCEAINRVFGINDMDMNTYAKNLSTNRHGIFNFIDRYAFRMSSRPDFYNRMTIFLSQMKADGCYEAHSIDKDGNLIYDCKKDKRYKALWDGTSHDSPEFKKALSRYISVGQQFVREGAKNSDGILFEFNISNLSNIKELPRAYTVQESESRKDVADSLYGYYDHTKKALFFGTYLGSLLGQMKTYWSAKKNQYLGVKGGNKIKGRWVQLKDDNGEPLFYKLKENGEVDYNSWDTVDTGFPVEQWQGDYSEGVLVTLGGIIQEIWNNDDKSLGGMLKTVREKFIENPDENYRRCYVTNLKILAYDVCMSIMLGLICLGLGVVYDDLEDDAKKSEDLTDVILADAFGLFYKSFNYAKLDFFWWDSIFSPTIDWNPFVVSSTLNTVEQVADFVTGEKNAFIALGNMFGFARQNKPLFRYLAQQTEIFDE